MLKMFYYSPAFVFSTFIVINLYGAASGGRAFNSEMEPQDHVLNIGNGANKKNVVVIDSDSTGLGNRFGNPPAPNVNYYNRPSTTRAPVNSGSWTPPRQGSASNNWNNGGVSFTAPNGNDHFDVGYGKDNHNQIFLGGRPVQHTAPVNKGRTNYQTRSRSAFPTNNGGYRSGANNVNEIYINGRPVQPDRNDGIWSTYQTSGQTIHVLNQGSLQSTNRANHLKSLYGISAQIEKLRSEIMQEAARNQFKL